MKILLLGASFDTGNLGVSALAESSIKCILHRWPDAEVKLFASGRSISTKSLYIHSRKIEITNIPVRFSKNIFLSNHILVLFLYSLILGIFRNERLKHFCISQNKFVKIIIEADMVVDITGGDSFSDIYGMLRLIMGFVRKWIVLLFNNKLIFLPQTYGPFKNKISKFLSAFILEKSEKIFSRDSEGIEYLRKILKEKAFNEKVSLMPDVAFLLDPKKPKRNEIESIINLKKNNKLIGLNISGLLYNGGYSQNNMFGLSIDYKELINEIIQLFITKKNVIIFLIPHVIPEEKLSIESDPLACSQIYNIINEKHKGSIYQIKENFNHNEIKYIIGMMDFFLGSRMHSCIAAISQCVPAIGLAYSKKFYGVFKTVGMEKFVGDMRTDSLETIIDIIANAYKERKKIVNCLNKIMPEIKEKVINIFEKF